MAFNQFPQKGGIPSGNTAARPSGPVIGDTFYNGQLGLLEIYDGTNWVPSSSPAAIPTITATDVGTNRAYTSGAILFNFVPGTNGGSPYGYTAIATIGASSYSTTSTSTSMTLTVGTNGSYSATGTAYNGFGTSPANPALTVAVTTIPETRTIGTATASTSANEITVSWTNGNNGGKNLSAITITPYLNGTTAETSRTAATTSSTSYTFTEGQLTGSAAYTFKVTATNANGTSDASTATNSATMPNNAIIDFLVIAGGGGGGQGNAGGGGAGGYRTSVGTSGRGGSAEATLNLAKSTNFTVTIGAGGGAQTNGSNSVFSTVTSLGGGASRSDDVAGNSGGCGGGGSDGGNAGAGTANQGYDGGYTTDGYGGAGGGGAGATGGSWNGSSGNRNGGAGQASTITGTSVTRAGGGGGQLRNNGSEGTGSDGGGNSPSGNGTANTGGGGGAGSGSGGSGIVILRYIDSLTITIGAGLTGTVSAASGGYKRATITAGTGNVSWA